MRIVIFIAAFLFLSPFAAVAQEATLGWDAPGGAAGIVPGSQADGARTYSGRVGQDTPVRVLRAKAKDGKNLDAQFDLCSFYAAQMAYEESLKWCQMAADLGDVEAQLKMGDIYSQGLGVTADKKEAFNWYLFAADNGSEQAQQAVASAYSNGDGVAQNNAEAWFWLSVTAGANESEMSRQHREELAQGFDEKTRAALEQRLAGWKAKKRK
jgi:hypothetical protein